jgi:hypothetical protein
VQLTRVRLVTDVLIVIKGRMKPVILEMWNTHQGEGVQLCLSCTIGAVNKRKLAMSVFFGD